jgi:hypothetical protein
MQLGHRLLGHRHAACEVFRVEAGELAFYVEDDAGEVRRSVGSAGAVVAIAGANGIEMTRPLPA